MSILKAKTLKTNVNWYDNIGNLYDFGCMICVQWRVNVDPGRYCQHERWAVNINPERFTKHELIPSDSPKHEW